MAESAMNESLEVTRMQLRRFLLPETVTEDQDDGAHFPRSKVMRFALNPRNRPLLMLSGSVLAVVASRMVGARKFGLVADVLRSITHRKS
jgi:hypothetical protein